METILVINPGSTSTKIAVYQDENPLFVESIEHSQDEIKKYENIIDQYEMRKDLILETMERKKILQQSFQEEDFCLLSKRERTPSMMIWYGSLPMRLRMSTLPIWELLSPDPSAKS